jgi:hypothetical protein
MIVVRRIAIIRGVPKSSQDPTVGRSSPAAAFFAQRLKLALQAFQFREPLFYVTEMGIQQGVDLATVFLSPGAESQQNPDFVQRHVQGSAMANEREQLGVLLLIAPEVRSRPGGFWQQSLTLVIPNRLDSASRCPGELAYRHLFMPARFSA